MENVLTIAGVSQLLLSLWVMDWVTTVPGLLLGAAVFGLLVGAVRQIVTETEPARRPAPKAFKAPRVIHK